MRIAMIGLGSIACKAYLPLVATHQQITPLLCTRNSEKLQALSQQYRIEETYQSVAELLAAGVDAVMIHSTTDSHFALTKQFLQAGIAVFVDKPLSYSLAESEQLLNLAAQKNLPLFVGFNRRYAPLIQPLSSIPAVQVLWQKNRVNLPNFPRVFVLDDFIHLLDGLRYLAPVSETVAHDLQVFSYRQGDKLGALRVQWQSGDCLLSASMNRLSGMAEERLEFYGFGQGSNDEKSGGKNGGEKWQIENLNRGYHYRAGTEMRLGFNDWDATLHKRGFTAMLEAWLDAVRLGTSDSARLDDIRATHALCEQVINKIVL